jgi:hypothetical protein
MAKKRARSQISNTFPNQLKVGIALISLHVGGVPHIVQFFLMGVITFLQTSSQSEFYTQSYGPPKS